MPHRSARAAVAAKVSVCPSPERESRHSVVAEALEGRCLLSTYYVSTAGSDTNPGSSLTAPFKTIQRAANVVKAGDTVLIRGGTYRETVRPANSGNASAHITFKNYNAEPVTISGADVVSGWGNYSKSIYKAPQSWDMGFGENQVFVDGQMVVEARWPNTSLDIAHPAKATLDKVNGSTFYDSAITQASGTWDGATIHFLAGQEWVAQTGSVTKSVAGQLNVSYKSMGGDAVPQAGDRYYLTGKFSALDSAGEWFRDPSSGQLYLWTPNSDHPAKHVVEARAREWAFDLRLRSYIDIQGLKLFSAGVISSASSNHLSLTNLDVKYPSHFTLMSTGWSRPNTTGIVLQGDSNVLSNSVIAYSAGHGVVIDGRDSRVENCVVYGAAYNAGDDAGIRATGMRQTITNNTVFDTGRSGIKVSNTTNVKVLNNVVHDAMLQTTDGGGIYTYGMDGSGSEIAGNRVYNIHTGGWGGVGIFLDNGSHGFAVHHNLTYNVDHALKMNPPSRDNRIYNNTLDATSTSVETNRSRDMIGSSFINNIFTRKVNIGSGTTQRNNLFAGADARFVNPTRGDYRLLPGSAAINKGVALGAFTSGYAGVAPDIGAIEFGSSPFNAGAAIDSGVLTPSPSVPPAATPAPSEGSAQPPSPSAGPAQNLATSIIQAEKHDAASGIRSATYSVGYAEGGDWLKFGGVDFGAGVSVFSASIAVAAGSDAKQIEVRVGSPTGQLAGTLTTRATGGWNVYQTQSTKVSGLSGAQDIYIVFRNSSSGIANMDWITFS